MALHRLQKGRPHTVDPARKLSIAAVAEEAGVSAATIHNRYPEIADQIRRLLDKEARKQRDAKHQHLQAEKAKNRVLRETLRDRDDQTARLASINAALEAENAELRAIVESGNVTPLPKL
jgi:AcrR family transcriptional regulator